MGITGEIVLFVVGLTVLALVLTGPGMWSEKWGWRWFGKDGWTWLKKRKKKR